MVDRHAGLFRARRNAFVLRDPAVRRLIMYQDDEVVAHIASKDLPT